MGLAGWFAVGRDPAQEVAAGRIWCCGGLAEAVWSGMTVDTESAAGA